MRCVPGGPRRRRPVRSAAAPLALMAVLSGLSGCGGEDAEGISEVHEAFERGDAESVIGRERTFEGRVEDVISPWAFTVGGDEFGDVEPLLVIEKDMPSVDEDDPVRVTGTVHEFDFGEVQDELGANLAETLYEGFRGEPYVMARSIAEDVDLG